jgi:hypothetical protein
MRFKIDENLPIELADLLRSAGHDVMTVLTCKRRRRYRGRWPALTAMSVASAPSLTVEGSRIELACGELVESAEGSGGRRGRERLNERLRNGIR